MKQPAVKEWKPHFDYRNCDIEEEANKFISLEFLFPDLDIILKNTLANVLSRQYFRLWVLWCCS